MHIAIVGFSNTGKTTAFRNLSPSETFFILPSESKLPLPFQGYSKENKNLAVLPDFDSVIEAVDKINKSLPHIKYLVLEDTTHLIHNMVQSDEFANMKSGGLAMQKWADLGRKYKQILTPANIRSDLTIFVVFHIDVIDTPNGKDYGVKSKGKVISDLDPLSWFTIALQTKVEEYDSENPNKDRHFFVTANDGTHTLAKSPIGMFEMYEPNDMKVIVDKLQKFYS